jgi:hypothetical protein
VKVKFEIQRFREFDNDVCGYKHQNFCMDGEITEMGILNCLSRVKSQYQGTYGSRPEYQDLTIDCTFVFVVSSDAGEETGFEDVS